MSIGGKQSGTIQGNNIVLNCISI